MSVPCEEMHTFIKAAMHATTAELIHLVHEWGERHPPIPTPHPVARTSKRKLDADQAESLNRRVDELDRQIKEALAVCETIDPSGLTPVRWNSPQGVARANIRQWTREYVNVKAELLTYQNRIGGQILDLEGKFPRFIHVPDVSERAYILLGRYWYLQGQHEFTNQLSTDYCCLIDPEPFTDITRCLLPEHSTPIKLSCQMTTSPIWRTNPVESTGFEIQVRRITGERPKKGNDTPLPIIFEASDLATRPRVLEHYDRHQGVMKELREVLFIFPDFPDLVEEYLMEKALRVACENTLCAFAHVQ